MTAIKDTLNPLLESLPRDSDNDRAYIKEIIKRVGDRKAKWRSGPAPIWEGVWHRVNANGAEVWWQGDASIATPVLIQENNKHIFVDLRPSATIKPH